MSSSSSLSSLSSLSDEEIAPEPQLTVRQIKANNLLRDMICWLVHDGYKAMKRSLKNGHALENRTDLGEQNVRIAEVRQMTAAAYASEKPTRVKFWRSKLIRMKTQMRQKVDEHLDQCSEHEKYRKLRKRIDAMRKDISESEARLSIKRRDRIDNEQNEASGSNEDPPSKKRRIVGEN